MVIHSIIDPNEIFATENQPELSYKNMNGLVLEGIKSEDGVFINRIISTNPSDYLNKDFKIGGKFGKFK